uniref:Uncharacterized protein n=1 Tax=Arundo donax TaxID=35708 RepID=A0A0A9FDU1_ARUDO
MTPVVDRPAAENFGRPQFFTYKPMVFPPKLPILEVLIVLDCGTISRKHDM